MSDAKRVVETLRACADSEDGIASLLRGFGKSDPQTAIPNRRRAADLRLAANLVEAAVEWKESGGGVLARRVAADAALEKAIDALTSADAGGNASHSTKGAE